jgi:hypothetical protein
MGEWMYRSLALIGDEWSASRPCVLPPDKELSARIGEKAGCALKPAWMTWIGEESCPCWDSKPNLSAVQFVTSLYTDWAIPAHRSDLKTDQIGYLTAEVEHVTCKLSWSTSFESRLVSDTVIEGQMRYFFV